MDRDFVARLARTAVTEKTAGTFDVAKSLLPAVRSPISVKNVVNATGQSIPQAAKATGQSGIRKWLPHAAAVGAGTAVAGQGIYNQFKAAPTAEQQFQQSQGIADKAYGDHLDKAWQAYSRGDTATYDQMMQQAASGQVTRQDSPWGIWNWRMGGLNPFAASNAGSAAYHQERAQNAYQSRMQDYAKAMGRVAAQPGDAERAELMAQQIQSGQLPPAVANQMKRHLASIMQRLKAPSVPESPEAAAIRKSMQAAGMPFESPYGLPGQGDKPAPDANMQSTTKIGPPTSPGYSPTSSPSSPVSSSGQNGTGQSSVPRAEASYPQGPVFSRGGATNPPTTPPNPADDPYGASAGKPIASPQQTYGSKAGYGPNPALMQYLAQESAKPYAGATNPQGSPYSSYAPPGYTPETPWQSAPGLR